MQQIRKKRVFIGSSSETKELAIKIQERITQNCDCFVWWDDFFRPGGYVYDDLIKKAISFDYAILIGGADDRVIRLSSNDEKLSPRDNVYLEYGMYSGILSTNRILLLMNEDCRVASDLAGMTLKTYKTDGDALAVCEEWMNNALEGKFSNDYSAKGIELLPTVGVAVGYFYNFLEPALNVLASARKFTFEDREYAVKDKKLIVNIPTYLECGDNAVKEYTATLVGQKNLEDAFLGRYRVLVDPSTLEDGVLTLYDMPSTLLAVLKTVDYVFGISTGAGTEDAQNAKYRALDNFVDTLMGLMSGKPRLANYLEFRRFGLFDT